MANVKYSDMLDEVLPLLAADPSDPVTENAIKRSAVEFCATSWVWKYLTDPVQTTPGEPLYMLDALPGSDVATVLSVELGGIPLECKTVEWLNANEQGWRTRRGTPRYYAQVDTEEVMLAPVPDTAAELTTTLALQPSHTSTGIPKWIFTQHIYTLVDGALAKLMLMPGKPWSDAQNGAMRLSSFEKGMANASAVSANALGRAVTRTTSQH